MKDYISVIIPCNHSVDELYKVVCKICDQSYLPDEIVIVNSSLNKNLTCPHNINEICKEKKIKIIYKYVSHSYPGHARNIGLSMSKGSIVAFIDVMTLPKNNWIETSLIIIYSTNCLGVWGSTQYIAVSGFESLVVDALYGNNFINTLPGSVFKKDLLLKNGQFIEKVRAGEDTEWILRSKMLNLRISQHSSITTEYIGLVNISTIFLIKKWVRNYMSASNLPHFNNQKFILIISMIQYYYRLLLIGIILLLAGMLIQYSILEILQN